MTVFGSATPISKMITGAMPVFVASSLRVLLGAIALAPVALREPACFRRLGMRVWVLTALIAIFGMFGFTVLMLEGMRMVSGVVGAVVMSTAPAVTAAASMCFAGDRPTWRKLVAIGLSVAGVLVTHLGQVDDAAGGEHVILGSAIVFAAVCCEAAYTLLGKRVSERVDPIVVAFLASVISLPLFLPLAVWQWDAFSPREVPPVIWGALAWYGVGTLALGTWLWYSGVREVEGAVAAAFMGVMPVSALLLSYVLLSERFEWLHLAGFAIVLVGVLLVSWEHARQTDEGRRES